MRPDALRVYVVTDPALTAGRPMLDVCREALSSGATALQLRDEKAGTRQLLAQAVELKKLADLHRALFIVNDRADVARAAKAHGLHVGQDDLPIAEARAILGPDAVIGASVRTPDEARAARAAGADYLAASPVFVTPTKTDTEAPIGLDGVAALRAATDLPLVAIGGIHAGNAEDVAVAGADGVAVVSAVMAAPDVRAACVALREAVERGLRRRNA